MQITDIGHGRGWLDAPAAASLRRVDAALGHPLRITEAGRTRARQEYLYDGWVRRLPGFNYAAAPGTSPHERGDAFDSDEAQRHLTLLAEHGWSRPLTFEPWHFLYRASQDRHRTDPAPSGAATTQEDDMTPDQAAQLAQLAQDVAWLKSRIGGKDTEPTLSTRLTGIAGIVQWLKDRIGGSTKSAPTITDELRGLRS